MCNPFGPQDIPYVSAVILMQDKVSISHCHYDLTDTKMRRDLHSDDVLNVKVFQRCGVGVLSFVILDNYLLYDSV